LGWTATSKSATTPCCYLVVSGGDDKTVRLWDCRSRACVHTFYDRTATVNSVVWHPSITFFDEGIASTQDLVKS